MPRRTKRSAILKDFREQSWKHIHVDHVYLVDHVDLVDDGLPQKVLRGGLRGEDLQARLSSLQNFEEFKVQH